MAAWCQLRKKRPSQQVSALLTGLGSRLFKNQIFIVSSRSLLRPSLPALWWINISKSDSYSEPFRNLIQMLTFSTALWGKHFGKGQQSGNLQACDSDVGKSAQEVLRCPTSPAGPSEGSQVTGSLPLPFMRSQLSVRETSCSELMSFSPASYTSRLFGLPGTCLYLQTAPRRVPQASRVTTHSFHCLSHAFI